MKTIHTASFQELRRVLPGRDLSNTIATSDGFRLDQHTAFRGFLDDINAVVSFRIYHESTPERYITFATFDEAAKAWPNKETLYKRHWPEWLNAA